MLNEVQKNPDDLSRLAWNCGIKCSESLTFDLFVDFVHLYPI